MSMFWVELDTKQLRAIRAALLRLNKRALYWKDEIPRQGAALYVQQVINNIISNKFSASYPGYSDIYKKYKPEGSPFWKLAGDLIAAVSFERLQQAGDKTWFFAGIKRGLFDSGGKNIKGRGKPKEIYWYAMIQEYGGTFRGQVHPARPLFGPTFNNLADTFDKKLEVVYRDFKGAWR